MSVKAWITEIRNMEEWEEFDAAFVADMEKVDEHGNKDGHECWWEYAIKLDEDMGGGFSKIEAGTVMVAWSADSGVYLPVIPKDSDLAMKTWSLQGLLEEFPEWHTEPGGPAKFGTMAERTNGERNFSRWLSSKGVIALLEDS